VLCVVFLVLWNAPCSLLCFSPVPLLQHVAATSTSPYRDAHPHLVHTLSACSPVCHDCAICAIFFFLWPLTTLVVGQMLCIPTRSLKHEVQQETRACVA
jgi:hypothetical protein